MTLGLSGAAVAPEKDRKAAGRRGGWGCLWSNHGQSPGCGSQLAAAGHSPSSRRDSENELTVLGLGGGPGPSLHQARHGLRTARLTAAPPGLGRRRDAHACVLRQAQGLPSRPRPAGHGHPEAPLSRKTPPEPRGRCVPVQGPPRRCHMGSAVTSTAQRGRRGPTHAPAPPGPARTSLCHLRTHARPCAPDARTSLCPRGWARTPLRPDARTHVPAPPRPASPRPVALLRLRPDADVRTAPCFLFAGHHLDVARPAP